MSSAVNLTRLDLSSNSLSSLPQSFENLDNLQVINLNQNLITDVAYESHFCLFSCSILCVIQLCVVNTAVPS